MPVRAHVPHALSQRPFRGTLVVASGLLTAAQLRGSAWRRLFPDVYIASAVPLDHRRWCEAALIYAGAGFRPVAISGLSAAYLMGVDLRPLNDDRVEVTVPHRHRLRDRHLKVSCARLADTDLTYLVGLMVTNADRTAFDLARRLDKMDAVAAVDALMHRHLTSPGRLRSFMLATASASGRRRIAEVLDLADPRAESPMESRLRVTLINDGLPRPVCQVVVRDEGGLFVARLDLAYPEKRVGVEYEGDHHRETTAFRRDIARVTALQQLNWTIVRATAEDVRNPDNLLRLIRRLIE